MGKICTRSEFDATVQCPEETGSGDRWTFVLLPKDASEKLPRRGRTSVRGKINGIEFTATLEPDGQQGHWLKISEALGSRCGAGVGEIAKIEIESLEEEPDPELPTDFREALRGDPEALATWERATTLARVDWIHWVESAKQMKTRQKRIGDACDKLSSGEKRVCCFDPSGYYSRAFGAPAALKKG